MNEYAGITIELAVPHQYAARRTELRRIAKQTYPGASIRTKVISKIRFPDVVEVSSGGNHPLLSGGAWRGPPEGETIIISSLRSKFYDWARQVDANPQR